VHLIARIIIVKIKPSANSKEPVPRFVLTFCSSKQAEKNKQDINTPEFYPES
jgi:hypothetical protein